jgi:restriction system protein
VSKSPVPTFDAFMNPLLDALKELGGSGTLEEIANRVAEIVGLSDAQLEVLHNPDRGAQTEFEYRLAWTRTYLKKYGLLENSSRGIWALTSKGTQVESVDPKIVKRYVHDQRIQATAASAEQEIFETDDVEVSWRDDLLTTLQNISSSAFERLAQRILRESGFIQVEVTGRSSDGGIDGKGIMRLGGMLSFHVIFQCKRYQGSVGAREVRDFRGAMVGRADKGLLITTGSFTREAIREATRDGAPAIDLIDGEQLLEILKELGLGVKTTKVEVEQITVEHDWFANI